MATKHSEEFKRDAVRMALTSGLSRRQLSSDLGVGLSSLNKWVRHSREDDDVLSCPDRDLLQENERLRREVRLLRDLSRARKQSGRLFSRRKWEVLKKLSSSRV